MIVEAVYNKFLSISKFYCLSQFNYTVIKSHLPIFLKGSTFISDWQVSSKNAINPCLTQGHPFNQKKGIYKIPFLEYLFKA